MALGLSRKVSGSMVWAVAGTLRHTPNNAKHISLSISAPCSLPYVLNPVAERMFRRSTYEAANKREYGRKNPFFSIPSRCSVDYQRLLHVTLTGALAPFSLGPEPRAAIFGPPKLLSIPKSSNVEDVKSKLLASHARERTLSKGEGEPSKPDDLTFVIFRLAH